MWAHTDGRLGQWLQWPAGPEGRSAGCAAGRLGSKFIHWAGVVGRFQLGPARVVFFDARAGAQGEKAHCHPLGFRPKKVRLFLGNFEPHAQSCWHPRVPRCAAHGRRSPLRTGGEPAIGLGKLCFLTPWLVDPFDLFASVKLFPLIVRSVMFSHRYVLALKRSGLTFQRSSTSAPLKGPYALTHQYLWKGHAAKHELALQVVCFIPRCSMCRRWATSFYEYGLWYRPKW